MSVLGTPAGDPATFPVISRIPRPDRRPSLQVRKGDPMGTYVAERYMPGIASSGGPPC
jgi:hypothetical protein